MYNDRSTALHWRFVAGIGLAVGLCAPAIQANGFGSRHWHAEDPPAAVKQLLRLGDMPAGYQVGVRGSLGDAKSEKVVGAKGPKGAKSYEKIVKDDAGNPKLEPAFKANLIASKVGAKQQPAKPKVELKAEGSDLLAKPFNLNGNGKLDGARLEAFDGELGKKTVLKTPEGERIDKFVTDFPLVVKPVDEKAVKYKASKKAGREGPKWQLMWPATDLKALKRSAKTAKVRSGASPRKRVGLAAKVPGQVFKASGAAVRPAEFVVKKTFQGGEAVGFRIRERPRQPNIRLFSWPPKLAPRALD